MSVLITGSINKNRHNAWAGQQVCRREMSCPGDSPQLIIIPGLMSGPVVGQPHAVSHLFPLPSAYTSSPIASALQIWQRLNTRLCRKKQERWLRRRTARDNTCLCSVPEQDIQYSILAFVWPSKRIQRGSRGIKNGAASIFLKSRLKFSLTWRENFNLL